MAILARALPSRLLAFLLVAALGALAPEAARAQNPTCGATITSDTVLADHLDCSGTTGIALTIEGDGVTFDGNGFRVIAPNAQSVIRVVGDDNVVRRVDVSNPNGRSGNGVMVNGAGNLVDRVTANNHYAGIRFDGQRNRVTASHADNCSFAAYISRGWNTIVDTTSLTNSAIGLYLEDTWAPADLDRPVFPVPESVTYDGSYEAIVIYSGGNLTFEKLTIDNPVALRASAAANITVRDSDLSAATPGGDGVALGGSGGFHVHDVVANDRTRGILVTGPGNLIHDSAADGCNWGVYISRGWDARVANLALTHNNVGLYLEDTWAPADLDRPVFPVPESVTYDGSHEAIVIYSGGNLTFEKLTIDNPVALRASAAANITVRDSDLSAATPGGDGVALGGSGGFRVEGVIADDRTRGILVYGPNNSVRQSRSDGSHWGVYVSNGWDARVEGNALTHCKTGLYLEDTFAPSSMSRPVFQVAANNSFAGSETGIGLYSAGNLTFEDLALDNHYGFYGSRVANIDIVGGDFSAPGGAGGWGAYLAGDDNRLSDLSVVGRGVGVRLDGKGNSIATSDFSANQIAVVSNGSNTVNSSSFCGNTVAFYNGDNNAPSVATGNYWGAPSGPAPSGTGDAVSGAVTFTPFATQPPVGTGAFCGPVCGDGYCADDASENAATCEDDCYCGNGAIDGTEQCDGADLGGLTCASLGYDGGTLSCDPDCQLVEGECDNECATDNGGCAGTCTNTATGYTCTCPAGYQLGGDGHACDDVNECQADNGGCTIYQTCVNQVGAPPTCADIDECAADNGGCGDPAFTTCTDNAGAPPTCADIDECATDHGGCADGFACVDVEGGLPLCEDIDECADAGTCDANATCANTLGGFTCTCDPGYEGDGATCSPVTACTLGPDAVMWHSPLTRSGGAETSPPAFEFKLNDGTIRVSVNAQDCDGQNSSSNPNVIGRVSVFLDGDCDGLTEVGDYQLAIDFNGAGGPGGLMYKNGDKLTYNLSTANWPATNGCYALEVNLANVVTHESKTERVLLKPKRR